MRGTKKSCRRMWSEEERSCPSISSYLDFYANIPDYSDLHDLSDTEFYERLESLKDAQKHFAQVGEKILGVDDGESVDRPSSQSSFGSRPKIRCRPETKGRTKPPPRVVVDSNSGHDVDWEYKDGQHSPCFTPPYHHHHHHQQRELCRSMGALSLDSSELRIHGEQCSLRPHSRATKLTTKKERIHDVPLLSRIPLFHKIMAEQEQRRRLIHERNSQELQALVQPFSFTKKEEAAKKLGAPCTAHFQRSQTPFRARPIPRQLFSDRAYDRIHEEQFYRELRKRIRAEEMLKSAKMPPSMEAREKTANKEKSKSLDFLAGKKVWRQRSRSRGYRQAQDTIAAQVEASNSAWKRRSAPKSRQPNTSSNTDSSPDASPNNSVLEPRQRARPASALSAARSNLAAVLRMQTSRNRMESMMKEQLEEQQQQEQSRFKARLVRLSPAWRTLDYSVDEDLALRLAQRRHEAKVQGRNHRRLMEAIRGRVHHIPPLFQDPMRRSCCNEHTHFRSGSKSLESSLNATGKHHRNSRKTNSFYLDRREVHKSSESSQAKSNNSKEDTSPCSTDSNDGQRSPN